MASDIDRTIATARRLTAVVQYFFTFYLTSQGIGFCNVECQMSNVGSNLTHVVDSWSQAPPAIGRVPRSALSPIVTLPLLPTPDPGCARYPGTQGYWPTDNRSLHCLRPVAKLGG